MDNEEDRPIERRADEEAGTRGGAAAFAAARPGEDVVLAWAKTVVRWSPIWVGLLVAMAINLVLYILGLAVALSTAELTTGDFARQVLQTAGIWSAISSLVALFVGGFLAGRLGVQTGLRNGILQGTMVWTLFVIIGLLLGAFGLGGFVSGLTSVSDLRVMMAGRPGVTPTEAQTLISGAARSMWWVFGGLLVSWLAAILGGYLGVKSARPEGVSEAGA